MLSSVTKSKKAVICIIEEMSVLGKLCSDKSQPTIDTEAYLKDTVCSAPDHRNKAGTAI